MKALSLSHAPRPSPERPLDQDLRGYLEIRGHIVLGRLARRIGTAQIVEFACVAGLWKFYSRVQYSLRVLLGAALQPEASNVKRD